MHVYPACKSGRCVKSRNLKNTKISPIHENADANITCDFGDGDISRLGVAYQTHVIHNYLDYIKIVTIYLQLGHIQSALADLDKAIELEPMLVDAYWHRHLVYILQNKTRAALENLGIILKYNKTNAAAFRSR